MLLLRVFAQQGLYSNWSNQEPPLPKLLQCFDIQRNAPNPPPTSVYLVRNELESVEVAAALFQTAPSAPEKRFGVCVSDDDCRIAGVRIDFQEKGQTGISAVDERYANLIGNQQQFGNLMVRIVASIWAGQHRLQVFPAHQILGQVAVFSKLSHKEICPESQNNCQQILALVPTWHSFVANGKHVNVCGNLHDKDTFNVIAARKLERPGQQEWWLIRWLRSVLGKK